MDREAPAKAEHSTLSAVASVTDARSSEAVTWLVVLVAVLAAVTSAVGLFSAGGAGPFRVTSIRGEDVELSGTGLYYYDTVFMAAGTRGTDVATLALAVPLVVVALVLYRRGSVRAGLVLVGGLTYFLYVYASRALYTAYNGMFLLYIAAFSASLFGVLLAGRAAVATPFAGLRMRRGLAGFLIVCGVVTSAVWLLPLVGSLLAGEPPKLLDTYATSVTDVLDLGVIVPTLFATAALVLRRSRIGYVLASAMIILLVLTAVTIILGTVLQIAAGVAFTAGEVVGPISGFLVLGLIGIVLLVRLLREVSPAGARQQPS